MLLLVEGVASSVVYPQGFLQGLSFLYKVPCSHGSGVSLWPLILKEGIRDFSTNTKPSSWHGRGSLFGQLF